MRYRLLEKKIHDDPNQAAKDKGHYHQHPPEQQQQQQSDQQQQFQLNTDPNFVPQGRYYFEVKLYATLETPGTPERTSPTTLCLKVISLGDVIDSVFFFLRSTTTGTASPAAGAAPVTAAAATEEAATATDTPIIRFLLVARHPIRVAHERC